MQQDTSNVRIMRENPYARPLENAIRIAGGDTQLAEALRISTQALSSWLAGESAPPMRTYMAALHLVGRSSLRSRAA
jgi:transcriptional regulator with XRE-family HTH domain